MITNKLFVGMEGIIDGWRWVQVEELTEDNTAIVVDQDGQDFEVTLGDFDHIYTIAIAVTILALHARER